LIEGLSANRLGLYSGWCGWALARAHAKSGAAAMISGYVGSSSQFDKAVAKFALAYAEQNERDYKALLKAIRDGRIKTLEE
jgi:NAD(P)H-dependent flavin oxidoreductase YrpB (nitropropane dioxygenase family)